MAEEVKRKPRVRALRRLAAVVLRHSQIISVICYIAGLVTVLLLPVFSKPTYISENALMPGSANSVFGSKSATDARLMVEELHNLDSGGYMAVRRWAIKRMSAIGADSYLHTFLCPEKPFTSMRFFSSPEHNWNETTDGNLGVNVVGIIKAPRSEGNEAVVLVTPFSVTNGKLSAADKLTLSFGMALFELYGSSNWLARDVIWILADARYGSYTAVAAWLEEYHEPKRHSSLEFKRAGSISAGLVFHVSPGYRGKADFIKVSAEGPNGQMPNLDLINVINTLAQWRRVPIHLEEIKGMRDSAFLHGLGRVIENVGSFAGKLHRDWGFAMSASTYVESLATLCASFLNQAIGRSTGAHGAFRDYQIDAVTLNMFASGDLETSTYQIDLFTRFGRLVEGVMRSVNNLLEKFHQSFFLYLLCSPSRFVSVGLYMIPLGLLLVTLPLGAAALNAALVKAAPETEESLDIKTTKENAGRWRHAILVVSAVQLWAFLVALFPPVASLIVEIAPPAGALSSATLKMSLWAVMSLLSLVVVFTSLPPPKPSDWMAVKALVLGIATIGLVVMSQVDFAVSLMGAVVLVPTCLCPSPLKERRVSSLLGSVVTFLGSPPVLAAVLLGNVHGLGTLWEWTEVLWSGGSALYIFVVAVYLPASCLSLHVLFS